MIAALSSGNLSQTFDAASDAVRRPRSWSFGWQTAPEARFQLYPAQVEFELWGKRFLVWSRSGAPVLGDAGCCPFVAATRTGGDLHAGELHVRSDSLWMHPGKNGEASVVRWIAPANGTCALEASFEAADYATVDVYVIVAGRIRARGTVEGPKARQDFSITGLTCKAGDAIAFAVGVGANRTYVRDSTRLRARIVLKPADA